MMRNDLLNARFPSPGRTGDNNLPAPLSRSLRGGSVTLEMALVEPIFFFMVFGIIEVGRGFMVTHLLRNAARDGCRYAILQGTTTTQIKSIVTNDLASQGINGSTVTVAVNDDTRV